MFTGAFVTGRAQTRHTAAGRLEDDPLVHPGGGWGVSGWETGLRGRRSLVPFDLVEEAQGSAGRADLRRLGGELRPVQLSQGELQPEVGEVQILLVDDGRDARVDL